MKQIKWKFVKVECDCGKLFTVREWEEVQCDCGMEIIVRNSKGTTFQ